MGANEGVEGEQLSIIVKYKEENSNENEWKILNQQMNRFNGILEIINSNNASFLFNQPHYRVGDKWRRQSSIYQTLFRFAAEIHWTRYEYSKIYRLVSSLKLFFLSMLKQFYFNCKHWLKISFHS